MSVENNIYEEMAAAQENTIYKMDCLEYTKLLTTNSIDSIILDPPYFNVVNEKWDKQWKSLNDYLLWIEQIICELERVSKHSGSLWIFGYAYQLSFIIPIVEKYTFTYRQHIVLDKGLRSVAGRTSKKLKMFPTKKLEASFNSILIIPLEGRSNGTLKVYFAFTKDLGQKMLLTRPSF